MKHEELKQLVIAAKNETISSEEKALLDEEISKVLEIYFKKKLMFKLLKKGIELITVTPLDNPKISYGSILILKKITDGLSNTSNNR